MTTIASSIEYYIALNEIEAAHQEDPGNIDLLLELAGAYRGIRDFNKVGDFLVRALELSGGEENIRFMYEENALLRRLTLSPDDVHTLNNLGMLYLKHGRPERAVETFKQSLDAAPYFPDTRVVIAHAYNLLEMPDRAAGHLRRALRLKPDMREAREALAGIRER